MTEEFSHPFLIYGNYEHKENPLLEKVKNIVLESSDDAVIGLYYMITGDGASALPALEKALVRSPNSRWIKSLIVCLYPGVERHFELMGSMCIKYIGFPPDGADEKKEHDDFLADQTYYGNTLMAMINKHVTSRELRETLRSNFNNISLEESLAMYEHQSYDVYDYVNALKKKHTDEIEELRNQIEELKARPGGEYETLAKEHFESTVNQL